MVGINDKYPYIMDHNFFTRTLFVGGILLLLGFYLGLLIIPIVMVVFYFYMLRYSCKRTIVGGSVGHSD